jgi:hypothetical protein
MSAVMAIFLCAAVSHAEESITIQILHKSFPNVKAEKAGKSVIPGLYEVEAGNNVFTSSLGTATSFSVTS